MIAFVFFFFCILFLFLSAVHLYARLYTAERLGEIPSRAVYPLRHFNSANVTFSGYMPSTRFLRCVMYYKRHYKKEDEEEAQIYSALASPFSPLPPASLSSTALIMAKNSASTCRRVSSILSSFPPAFASASFCFSFAYFALRLRISFARISRFFSRFCSRSNTPPIACFSELCGSASELHISRSDTVPLASPTATRRPWD